MTQGVERERESDLHNRAHTSRMYAINCDLSVPHASDLSWNEGAESAVRAGRRDKRRSAGSPDLSSRNTSSLA